MSLGFLQSCDVRLPLVVVSEWWECLDPRPGFRLRHGRPRCRFQGGGLSVRCLKALLHLTATTPSTTSSATSRLHPAFSLSSFHYNLSISGRLQCRIQFSKDSSTWYSSAGRPEQLGHLTAIGGADLDLAVLSRLFLGEPPSFLLSPENITHQRPHPNAKHGGHSPGLCAAFRRGRLGV